MCLHRNLHVLVYKSNSWRSPKRKLGRLCCLWAKRENFSAIQLRGRLHRSPEVRRDVELDHFRHGNLLVHALGTVILFKTPRTLVAILTMVLGIAVIFRNSGANPNQSLNRPFDCQSAPVLSFAKP